MGSEAEFGRTFRRHVTGVWHRIENPASPGMPDLVGAMDGYARARVTRARKAGCEQSHRDDAHAHPTRTRHARAQGEDVLSEAGPCARTVFVELKSLPSWQGDLGLSPEQRLWQARWADAGGAVFTLAKVSGIVYLVRGDRILRSGTREDWARASSYTSSQVDWKEVERCLLLAI